MERDIVLAKVATIQRCLVRIRQVTALDPVRLDDQIRRMRYATTLFFS